MDVHLDLVFTEHIHEVPMLPISILKPSFDYYNQDPILKILADKYQLLTFRFINQLSRKTLDGYITQPPSNFGEETIKIVNQTLVIGKYIMYPISSSYRHKILSSLTYYYHTIQSHFSKGDITIFKVIGPWEVNEDVLELHFELEIFLLDHGFSGTVKTVFIFITYGETITLPKKYHIDSKYDHEYIVEHIDQLNDRKINSFIKKSDHVYIDSFKIFSCNSCYTDILNLPIHLYLISKALEYLNEGGDLFLYNTCMPVAYPYIEMLYYVSLLFKSFHFLDNHIIIEHLGYIKFSKYNSKSELSSIVQKYKRKDKHLGQHNYTSYSSLYCNPTKKIYTPSTSLFIKHITNFVDNKFIEKLYDGYQALNDRINNELKKISQIRLSNIDSILSNNVFECIQFCNEHNIKINEIYNNFTPINYKKVIKDYFPKKSGISYDKLELSVDSIYSITRPEESLKLIRIIKHIFPKITSIIVGTSNVGTTTLAFASHYNNIYAVEIDKFTHKHLVNNISVYGFKNIKSFHDDITVFMKSSKLSHIDYDPNTFMLFLDPPWTGVFYKTEVNIDLYLSKINVIDFIKSIHVKYICMKIPFNYNIPALYKNFTNFTIYKLNGFLAVFIIQ